LVTVVLVSALGFSVAGVLKTRAEAMRRVEELEAEPPVDRIAVAKQRLRGWTLVFRALARRRNDRIEAVHEAVAMCRSEVLTMLGAYGADCFDRVVRHEAPIEMVINHGDGRRQIRIDVRTGSLEELACYLESDAAQLQNGQDLDPSFRGIEFSKPIVSIEELPRPENWLDPAPGDSP
jgi:hypothetical protein